MEIESPLLSEYVKHLSLERGLSLNTCRSYASDLSAYIASLNGRDPLKVSSEDLTDYLWELKSKKKLSPRSIFRAMEALRSFYKYQAAEERIADDPTRNFKGPHLPERLPVYLSYQEVDSLLRTAARAASGTSWEGIRIHAMIEMLYATGMRASEILALKPQDVNLAEGWLKVLGKGSKERLIPFNDRAKATLIRYLRYREEKFGKKGCAPQIFLSRTGARLSRPQFWRDLASLGKAAGLKQKVHPHLLRHSFASHLVQNGADLRSVQEMLGHASLTTTQIYTHLETSGIKDAHSKHHPRG